MSMVPVLPRAAWLAIGAIVAALLVGDDATVAGLPPAALLVASTLGLVGVVALVRMGRARGAALLLGLASVALRAAAVAVIAGGATVTAALPVGSGDWQASVIDISSPSGSEQRAFLRISDISEAGDPAASWTVYAWMPRYPGVVPGDVVAIEGSIEALPGDGSGFADFLRDRGAEGTVRARAMRLLKNGDSFLASVEQLRWGLDGALSQAIPEPEAGLAAGILIGLRERVSREVADDFMTTGLTHVVAISGWNIALVAGIATGLLRATGLRRRPRSLIVIAAIIGYTVLAGAEASVIRAAAMGGVVLIAREGGRPSGAAAALGVACWALLLVQPRMIDDIGLQLSLAATAGLLALGGPAEAAVRRATGGRAPTWFHETLGVSLAAQLATLPLILMHFGRLSLISPLANLLVAPVVPMAMLGAFIGVLIGPLLVAPLVSMAMAPLMLASWVPLALMVRGANLLAGVPLANLELASPFDMAGALIALVVLLLTLRRVRRSGSERGPPARSAEPRPQAPSKPRKLRAPAAVGAALLLVVVSSVVLGAKPANSISVTVLDIGQGDAILLESDDGRRILVDGGTDPDLLVRRLDERIPVWDRRIDMVLLTHPHEDHAGGLAGLAPRYRIGAIAETGMASEGSGVTGLRAAAIRYGIRRIRLAGGDELKLGSARITVVWPPRDTIPEQVPSSGRAINNTSLVLRIAIGRQRALLTGDVEEDRDTELLEALASDGRRWDLLKVAHHGSATATSQGLLDRLRPRLSVISSGTGNPYGHPTPATMGRIRGVGSKLWRTDTQGTFSVTLDGTIRAPTARRGGTTAQRSGLSNASPCPAAPQGRFPAASDGGRACYARPDGGPHPTRSAVAADVRIALAATDATRHGRRRGGLVPRVPHLAGRRAGRSAPGRHSRAPP